MKVSWFRKLPRKAHAYQQDAVVSLCGTVEIGAFMVGIDPPHGNTDPLTYCQWCVQIVDGEAPTVFEIQER